MCTQSVGVGDLVDLVELQNDKAFENLNYMHGLVTEICPNNLLKISLGDNMVIVVNRNEVQKWINTPSTATVSKISSKSKSKFKSKFRSLPLSKSKSQRKLEAYSKSEFKSEPKSKPESQSKRESKSSSKSKSKLKSESQS